MYAKSRLIKQIFVATYLIGTLVCLAKEEKQYSYVMKGNLALPTSQQPGPLFSFGQNIVDKGDAQAFIYIDQQKGHNKNFIDVIPSVVYGPSDNSSIFVVVPIAAKYKLDNACSSGIEDCFIQGEYAFYNDEHSTYINQATIVANITVPTGSAKKQPSTGFGATSFFVGATAMRLAVDWYFFVSPGAQITTKKCGTKFGDIFFYQGGFARNITYEIKKWIFSFLLELNGTYSKKNVMNNQINPNSGGNIITLGPSLWFSTQKLILQAGIAFPIYQQLNGLQNKERYFAAINIGWKFRG